MRVYFIKSVISIQWHRFDEHKQLIWWTVISVLVVYDHTFMDSLTVLVAFAKSALPGIGLILFVSVAEKHFRKLVRNFCDRKPGFWGRIFFRRHHHSSFQRWGLFYKQQNLPQQFFTNYFCNGTFRKYFKLFKFYASTNWTRKIILSFLKIFFLLLMSCFLWWSNLKRNYKNNKMFFTFSWVLIKLLSKFCKNI